MADKPISNSHDIGPTINTDFLQVTVTTDSRSEAEQLIKQLTHKHLVACAQVQGFESSCSETEAGRWRCRFKTSTDLYQKVCKELECFLPQEKYTLKHSPIVKGSEPFLGWLKKELWCED